MVKVYTYRALAAGRGGTLDPGRTRSTVRDPDDEVSTALNDHHSRFPTADDLAIALDARWLHPRLGPCDGDLPGAADGQALLLEGEPGVGKTEVAKVSLPFSTPT